MAQGRAAEAFAERNDRSWEPLAFEPHQDSGSWIECFNYGESRSYLFTIRKTYRFFFGLLADDEVEVVYDQISFSLRKGKFLKEKAELLRDRTQVMREAKEYTILEAEIRAMVSGGSTRKPAITSGRESDVVSKLQDRFARKSALADFVETKREEIQANRAWSDERKRVELERLEQLAEEASLEDSD